ncbi:hypothetical protein J3E69DRAFT_326202 [Trichoderma sp. SZMC 28015]
MYGVRSIERRDFLAASLSVVSLCDIVCSYACMSRLDLVSYFFFFFLSFLTLLTVICNSCWWRMQVLCRSDHITRSTTNHFFQVLDFSLDG